MSATKTTSSCFFGTDGIRGSFGEYPLSTHGAFYLGQALHYALYGARSGVTGQVMEADLSNPHGSTYLSGRRLPSYSSSSSSASSPLMRLIPTSRSGSNSLLVIAWDGRESAGVLCQGLKIGWKHGYPHAQILLLGLATTPACALAVQHFSACGGVMISASHNPYDNNGFKIFGPSGTKISERQQDQISAYLWQKKHTSPPHTIALTQNIASSITQINTPTTSTSRPTSTSTSATSGPLSTLVTQPYDRLLITNQSALQPYLDQIRSVAWRRWYKMHRKSSIATLDSSPQNRPGAKYRFTGIIDGAHGGLNQACRRMLSDYARNLGGSLSFLHTSPNGRNINHLAGCMAPEILSNKIKEARADFGLAIDGDGDRAVVLDHQGRIIDGSALLGVLALWHHSLAQLPQDTIVTTIMASLALDDPLSRKGIKIIRTPVGDRHISQAMIRGGYELGGEPSGHLIISEYGPGGDGIAVTLEMINYMSMHLGKDPSFHLAHHCAPLAPLPSYSGFFRVSRRPPLEDLPALQKVISNSEARLRKSGGGRVVWRYSGTEPILRIWVEGNDASCVAREGELVTEESRKALST